MSGKLSRGADGVDFWKLTKQKCFDLKTFLIKTQHLKKNKKTNYKQYLNRVT